MSRGRIGAAILSAAVLLGIAPAGSLAAAAGATSLAIGQPTSPVPVSRLSWHDCGGGLQCARMRVPLDYQDPGGRRVSLLLARLPATDPSRRIGSLFVDPGGPGDSGVDFLRGEGREAFTPAVRARFDIVGFDPRGVGGSTPLQCFDTNAQASATFRGVPVFPVTPAEERATIRANARLTRACARRAPDLAAHVSTGDVARDLDRMRAAVGDPRLTYVGYSYGTYLATVYANLFPDRVRAVVADGVVNPRAWLGTGRPATTVPVDARLKSDTGTTAALDAFLTACDRYASRCAFSPHGTRFISRSKVHRLLRGLRLHPAPGAQAGDTYADVVSTIRYDLYDVDRWPTLAHYLQDVWTRRLALASGTARVRTPRVDRRSARRAAGYDNYLDIAEAVTCSDSHNPTDPQAWVTYGKRRDRVSPYFGRFWTWLDEACATWSIPSPGRYDGPFDRRTSNPLLVVGVRNDPATRFRDAVLLSRTLARARLLTVDGTGHTTLGVHSACADAAISSYLLTRRLPPAHQVCRTEGVPFP